jgi:hypothetical protein
LLKLRRLIRTSGSGKVDEIIDEVFKDAPQEVKEVVRGILSINMEGKDPKEVAREIGIKLGIRDEDLDDFVDTVVTIADEVKEYLKPEK